MKILGLNAYHGDSSACVVINGRLIAAVEEERFRRVKHWAGFPGEAIRWRMPLLGTGIFQMKEFQILKSQREKIPAVTQVDGSGRLHTVSESQNSRYYNLIKEFGKITEVPMLLNTSFNENEPIVCKPEEALACFLRTKMDVMALGDWFLERGQ